MGGHRDNLFSKKESYEDLSVDKRVGSIKQGDKSLGDYYAILRELWYELSLD